MLLTKFLDPKNDFAFKRIFGSEKNSDILIHFINDVLGFEGNKRVCGVEFLKASQDPEIASKKQSLVDVLCTDEKGRQYIIEMQVARTRGFEKRAQYYAAKAYSRQLDSGENYAQLKEIIFIAITDFVMFSNKASYYSTHCLLDKESYSHDLKDFSFTFLELPKFDLSIEQLKTLREKWCYFFKHAEETSEDELSRIVGGDGVILRAYEELNRFSWSEVELNTYEQEEKRERDAQAILEQKFIEGEAKGRAEGEAKGRAEGEAKGRAEGEAKGRAEGEAKGRAEGELLGQANMVKKLLARGKTENEIMVLLDLTLNELTAILRAVDN